jgi:hypothetical protein
LAPAIGQGTSAVGARLEILVEFFGDISAPDSGAPSELLVIAAEILMIDRIKMIVLTQWVKIRMGRFDVINIFITFQYL